jgi:hypothetical protein
MSASFRPWTPAVLVLALLLGTLVVVMVTLLVMLVRPT